MKRVPVIVQGVAWATTHGHPVVIVRSLGDDCWFGVAATPGDAQALASCPCATGTGQGRLLRLLTALLDVLGATLTEVQLEVDDTGSLQARLLLGGAAVGRSVFAHGLDGMMLATMLGVPMTMSQDGIQRVARRTGLLLLSPSVSEQEHLSSEIQSFLASLDLEPLD